MMGTVLPDLGLAVVSAPEVALLVKATVVLLGAMVLLRVMPHASASARSLVVAAAFGGLLLLPVASALLSPMAIELRRPTPPPASAPVETRAGHPVDAGHASETGAAILATHAPAAAESIRSADSVPFRPLDLVRAVWLAGGLVVIVPLLMALWRARSLRRTAQPWPHGDALAREFARHAWMARRVEVLRHDGIAAPMTSGFLRPVILLPWDVSDWAETDVRRALIHELEHVRRGDWLTQVLARGVCAGYWFHPLVWSCWRHLHLDAERACDDAVVRQGDGAPYAVQLVGLAERMSDHDVQPILAMANPRELATRVRSVLDTQRRRERAGARWSLGAVAPALVCAVAMAPLRAVTVEGVSDRLLPAAVASSAEALIAAPEAAPSTPALVPVKRPQGPLESPPIPALTADPTPVVQTSAAGGPPQSRQMQVDLVLVDTTASDASGQPVRDLLVSEFTVFENGVEQTVEHFGLVERGETSYYLLSYRSTTPAPTGDNRYRRINVRVARPGVHIVFHRDGYYPQDPFSRGAYAEDEAGIVAPVVRERHEPSYASIAILTRIQGSVVVEAVVDVDGRVSRARVVSSLDKTSGLDNEAVKAVSRWTFTPGELNGQKVPVLMRLVVNFRLH